MFFFKLITRFWWGENNFEGYTQSNVCNRRIVNVKTFVIYAIVVLMYSGTDCLKKKKKDFRLLCLYQWVYAHWYFVTMSVALYCSQWQKKACEHGKKMKLSMNDVEVMRTNNNLRNDYNCHLSFVVHLYPQQ